MGSENRLRSLQMGVSGDDEITRFNRGADEAFLKFDKAGIKLVDGFACPKTQVERDLVVSATRGVKLPAHVSQAGNQHAFDVEMDIFLADVELEAVLGDLASMSRSVRAISVDSFLEISPTSASMWRVRCCRRCRGDKAACRS